MSLFYLQSIVSTSVSHLAKKERKKAFARISQKSAAHVSICSGHHSFLNFPYVTNISLLRSRANRWNFDGTWFDGKEFRNGTPWYTRKHYHAMNLRFRSLKLDAFRTIRRSIKWENFLRPVILYPSFFHSRSKLCLQIGRD